MSSLLDFARALADPTRLRVIRLVLEDALCVCELADILEMPQSSVSSHVQIIRRGGLLEEEKCEKWTYFRIARRHQELIRQLMRHFAESGGQASEADATRAHERLIQREDRCCPRPTLLNL